MKKIIFLFFVMLATFSVSYGQVASYAFSQSSGTYTPLIGGTTVATYVGGASGVGTLDDNLYTLPAGTIPFTFNYDGVGYDGFSVTTNGFITFGATTPAGNSYVPISATTAYAGAISAFGRDLEGGYVFAADRTTGSPTLLNCTNLGPIQVGDFIDGTGITGGTTVVAISGTTVTMSANATSTGTAGAVRIGGTWSNIQYGVEGTAPNRVFVVQFSNFKRFGTTLTNVQGMNLNFQIRLSETTNRIDIVYGNCTPGVTTFITAVHQVGLRGPNNTFATNVNNRLNVKGTSDWATSTPGTANTSGLVFNNVAPANVISSGLTYTWTPPIPCTGTPVAGTVAPANLNICSGSLPGNLVLSGFSSGVSGITFQWEQSLDNFATAGVPAVGGTGATTSTYTPPAYSGTPIYYRAVVTCTGSGLSSTSSVTSIGNPINPTTQASNAVISALTDVSATVNWTIGNGTRRVVVLSDSPTITDPVDGNAPALVANAVYAGTGQQIVFDGVGTTVNVTGLVNGNTYYTKVYEYTRCGAGPYDYFYNISTGTNAVSFTTVAPTIPSNDDCAAPSPLTVGVNFAANPLTGALYLSTDTAGLAVPSCQTSVNSDVWYTVVVPPTGNVTIETQVSPLDSITDSVVIVYSGACGSLTQVGCDDDGGPAGVNNLMSLLPLTGLTPGDVLYVVVRKFGTTLPTPAVSKFIVSAYDCPSATPAPTGSAAQSFCTATNPNPTVADLVATGTAVKWYDAPTGGNLLLSTTALVSGNIYYASQTLACESFARLAVTVTINSAITPTFDPIAPLCVGATAPVLPVSSTNGISGTWSPATVDTATAGTVTYTFTADPGQCITATVVTLSITVNVNPTVGFTANPFPICAGTSSVLTANVTNITATINYLDLASNAQSANMNAAAFGVPVTSPLSGILALAPSNGCAAFAPGLFTGKIALIQRGTCAFAIKAQNAQDAGAIGVILYNNVAGNLIPAGAAPGVTIPVYGITQANGLALIAAMTANEVNVTLLPPAPLTYSWSNGSTVSTTNTGILNADTDFTVLVTNTLTGCASSVTVTVPVTPNTIPTFDPVAAICSGDALTALPTTSTNGIAGTWSPALDNTTTTTYTFTPTPVGGQCLGTATLTITVNQPVTPTFDPIASLCVGAAAPVLPASSTNGISGTWSPATVDTATAGTVTYTFTPNSGQCASTTTLSITVNNCPLPGCFNVAFASPYPTATFTPATCNGLDQNNIAADCWAGEYSNVNVTSGQTYVFGSSIVTDFITISADGITALASGTGSVTWVSNLTGVVRFYTHLAACGTANVNRIRYVKCGIASTDTPDYVNLQWPPTIAITQGGSDTVYGQVYEGGLTDIVPNIVGQAPGINAWIGISPIGSNTNPNTWTNWVPATWNSGSVGNNDEYQATIGATLAPGTYYYATRFSLNNGPYVYGGYTASGGGFWDGTTNISGVLTVSPPPAPANDDCTGALPLTPGGVFADNDVTGTMLGATLTPGITPSCQATNIADVWYSVVVPASGSLTIETQVSPTTSLTDTVVVAFTGTCGALTPVGCDDDGGLAGPNNFMSILSLTAQTPGSTLYIGVWKFGATAPSATSKDFIISAYDGSLGTGSFDSTNFTYYPNPVKNTLNLSYNKEITNVEIFNLLGQKVISNVINANDAQVDMSNLSKGAYMVKVTSDNQVKTIKVIKE